MPRRRQVKIMMAINNVIGAATVRSLTGRVGKTVRPSYCNSLQSLKILLFSYYRQYTHFHVSD